MCDIDISYMYIGERKRPLNTRFKEHITLDKPTSVGEHCLNTGHSVSRDNMNVITREEDWLKRKVKEAIYISQKRPTINGDLGYQLHPHL